MWQLLQHHSDWQAPPVTPTVWPQGRGLCLGPDGGGGGGWVRSCGPDGTGVRSGARVAGRISRCASLAGSRAWVTLITASLNFRSATAVRRQPPRRVARCDLIHRLPPINPSARATRGVRIGRATQALSATAGSRLRLGWPGLFWFNEPLMVTNMWLECSFLNILKLM